MKLIKFFVVMFSVLFGASCLAADPVPLAILKNISSQMLHELDRHIGDLKHNDKLVYDVVNRVLVPHFDLDSMSGAVVGPDWRNASSSTKEQFKKEFTRYVIRTYSSALQSYSGETIKFYPIRGEVGDQVQVNSDLLLKSGPPIQIQYRLKQKGGQWLIYDFSVNGVSIIKNYSSQFASTLRQGGLSMLVKKLHENNARNMS